MPTKEYLESDERKSVKLTDELAETMRNEFVYGVLDAQGVRQYPSVEALFKKYNPSRPTLYRRAKKEGWESQRAKYQQEVRDKLDAERMDRMVEDASKLDDTCIQISQAILNQVAVKLQKSITKMRSNPLDEGIDAPVLSHLANVTANAQKIGKLALGEAQEISKVSADVSNPESFESIMEQLDELAESRSQANSRTLQ